jgi:hypothetical protein
MHALHLPDATLTYTVLTLALGFPVAVVLAWAFDVNAGAIERTPSTPVQGVRRPHPGAGAYSEQRCAAPNRRASTKSTAA